MNSPCTITGSGLPYVCLERMKTIPLTQGKVALVDDEDFEWLNQWKWCFISIGYAVRSERTGKRSGNKTRRIYMHRQINKTPDNLETDHINRNRLDNRKENLRSVTHSQNISNMKMFITNTSGCTGVSWCEDGWMARIQKKGNRIYLGCFRNISDAVLARKRAEKIYHTF